MRFRLLAAVVAVALGAGACSSGGDHSAATTEPPTRPGGGHASRVFTPALTWTRCGDVDCATLRVPKDRAHPSRGTLDLALVRHRATGHRIGALLTNPGGPGPDALWVAQQAADIFPDDVLSHFDIVSWDPRGVGSSTAVDCGNHLDYLWAVDHSPDTARELAANLSVAQRFVRGCEQHSGSLLPFVSSRATVSDMDAIRTALGDDRISYFGFSYGTYLGALYAATYPTHVRAMVLDGAIDPTLSWEASSEQQAKGFDGALDDFLADCSAHRTCTFHSAGHSARAYGELMAAIDAEPLFAKVHGETRTLGPGEADLGVADALYGGRQSWPSLAKALSAAAQGNGGPLLALSDDYTGREKGGTYSNETAAFYAISCLDGPDPTSAKQLAAAASRAGRIAPHFGASTMWLAAPCLEWPVKPAVAPGPLHATGAPRLLVLGTTHDPATPEAWAQALSRQLDARLLVLDGEGHTAYGRGSECIDERVDHYLLDGALPDPGTVCT